MQTPTLYFHNDTARITLHPAGEYVYWAAGLRADGARQQIMNQVLVVLCPQGWQKVLASPYI